MNIKYEQPRLSDTVYKAWIVLDTAIGPRVDPERKVISAACEMARVAAQEHCDRANAAIESAGQQVKTVQAATEALLAQYLARITTLQARVKQLGNEP